MTQIDKQKMKNIEEREIIDDIPTRIEMIRSEHSSTSKCKKHRPKVNYVLIESFLFELEYHQYFR